MIKKNYFLKIKNIDAIYIATPNTLHAKQSIESLKHRIPVLCEKPFAMNLKETEQMVHASIKNNTALLEGMWMRYLPHVEFLNQVLNEGHIGKIHSINACHGQNLKRRQKSKIMDKTARRGCSFRFRGLCSFLISNDPWYS